MNRLDVYYRALLLYKNEVSAKRSCVADNHAVASANPNLDNIYFERKSCEIDRTWVDEIEKGLVFIEKAIKEERQFIRTNGEVVPIEKVKNVSKSSVEHLARHSNLITRVQESEDIIPDALYTVEKLSDYAVYENKFLYMLLCYLRDFITLRYNKIMDISNTYNGSMSMKKTVKTEKNNLVYNVELIETRKEDEYLKANNPAREIIDRIDLLLKTVLSFLATPLMEMVSKVPMLKPPVTKTNVLKMNHNFKGAMELYAFITSYEGEGFTVHTETKHISPFDSYIAEEMASSVTLASFVTYQHALGIEKELKEAYLAEEQLRKDQALKSRLEKIEALKRKLKNKEITPEEYIIELEKTLREYEKRFSDYNRIKEKLEKTQADLEAANVRITELSERQLELQTELDNTKQALEVQKQKYIDDMEAKRIEHEREIADLNAAHRSEIENLNAEHLREIEEINNEHAEEIERINNEYYAELEELKSEHEAAIEALNGEHDAELERLNTEYSDRINAINEEHEKQLASIIEEKDNRYNTDIAIKDSVIADLNNKYDEAKTAFDKGIAELAARLDATSAENVRLQENCRVSEAKVLALKSYQNKLGAEDTFVTEDTFNELERMYIIFKKLYKSEWKKAKQKIRQDILWKKKAAKAGTAGVVAAPVPSAESVSEVPATENTANMPVTAEMTNADVCAPVSEQMYTGSYADEPVTEEIYTENNADGPVSESALADNTVDAYATQEGFAEIQAEENEAEKKAPAKKRASASKSTVKKKDSKTAAEKGTAAKKKTPSASKAKTSGAKKSAEASDPENAEKKTASRGRKKKTEAAVSENEEVKELVSSVGEIVEENGSDGENNG